MLTHKNIFLSSWIAFAFIFANGLTAQAQSKEYQRKKPTPATADASKVTVKSKDGKASPTATTTPGAVVAPGSEKLDIQELEQKYWAPKDTDFSVVQNRTYTKEKRWAASVMTGPLLNDPFNSGLTTAVHVNYYRDERMGYELMFQKSSLSDSDATDKFKSLSGGGVRPDFNRDTGFYGAGFNFVPFYAKMSFMGKKIIYFDMQITPFLGMSQYEQQSVSKKVDKSSFTYGLDVTQYFFFSNHWAARINLHNRFYSADVLAYQTGAVARKNDQTNTSMFLMGFTYFFK